MAQVVGRVMQMVAMVLLPIGLSYGIVQGEVRTEVKLLAVGGFLFLLGRILARETR